MGKSVIAIDLNPLSRTAKAATVTIVDNVVRAIPNMIGIALRMKNLDADRLDDIVSQHDNEETLRAAIEEIVARGVAGV
jgi:4-phosphopantoate--beta-alanine ligase